MKSEEFEELLWKNPVKFIDIMERETGKWFAFLNEIVGIVAFGFGLACLSLDNSQLYAWISLIFIFSIMFSAKHKFPQAVVWLRKKKNKTSYEQVILKGVESEFLGIRRSFRENVIFLFGLAFLIFVALGFNTKVKEPLINTRNCSVGRR